VKLPKKFDFEEAKKITGLSRTMLRFYIYADWPNAKLIERKKVGRRVFYEKLCDLSDPIAIAKYLLDMDDVNLLGYRIQEQHKK